LSTAADTPEQIAAFARFEAGARAALAMVQSFGADQPMVTAILVRLLVADVKDFHARPN
jgi:hypothetical protein